MKKTFSFNFSSFIGLILMLIVGYFAFKLARLLYIGLLYLSPVLIIIILFTRKQLLADFFMRLVNGIKTNALAGILSALISIFMLPFSLVAMTYKALLYNKAEKMQSQAKEFQQTQELQEYIDFDDLSTEKPVKKTIENWEIKPTEDRTSHTKY